MIILTVMALAMAAPSQTETNSKFKSSLTAYRNCVRSTAIELERAKESVLDTATAAFAACEDERAEHLFAILDLQKAGGNADPSIQKADESTKQLIDDGLRSEIIVRLMRLRAAGR